MQVRRYRQAVIIPPIPSGWCSPLSPRPGLCLCCSLTVTRGFCGLLGFPLCVALRRPAGGRWRLFRFVGSASSGATSSHVVRSAHIRSAAPFHTQSGLGTLPGTSLGVTREPRWHRVILKALGTGPGHRRQARSLGVVTGPTKMSEVAKLGLTRR